MFLFAYILRIAYIYAIFKIFQIMKKPHCFLIPVIFYFLIFSISAVKAQNQTSAPDVIFHNGTILTMETVQPEAQAIAIEGNLIIATGNNQEILNLQNELTRLVDLEGKTLMPGIVDPHSHLFFGGEATMGFSFEESQQWALENGITAQGEAYVNAEMLERIQNFEQEGKLIIRTSQYLRYTDACGVLLDNFWLDHPRTDAWGEKLRIAGVKVFTDGGTCGESAVSFEYVTGGYGDLWFTQEELNNILSEIQDAGHQVLFHAQGDRAVEQCQNAIEYVLNGQPNILRHRIDHNSYIRPEMLTRYTEIGIMPVIFAEFFTCSEQGIIAYIGTEPLPWFENWNDLLEANPGIPISWHSDAFNLNMNPFYNMYCYVTRQEIADDGTICEPSDWNKAATITVAQTLPLMTTGAAYALFRDDEIGSLKPGKLADVIILSGNPLTVNPDSLASIHVLMTMVDGIVEYCYPGNESLCPGDLGISPQSDNTAFGSIDNWPNPVTDHTTIHISLSSQIEGKLVLYDITGNKVDIIYQGTFPKGSFKIVYYPDGLGNGIYFYQFQSDKLFITAKMIMSR